MSVLFHHPSLALGSVVNMQLLNLLKQIESCQHNIDAAQDKLNSFLLMKRSISMTLNELSAMNIDVTALKKKQEDLNTTITTTAEQYLTVRIDNESKIQGFRNQLNELPTLESYAAPINFEASKLMQLPLAADSLKLDSKYFSYNSNDQGLTLQDIEKFVRASTGDLGIQTQEITKSVRTQVSQQLQQQNLAGTLIIVASCTHQQVQLFEPLVIDPDKAVEAWNLIMKDKIVLNPNKMVKNVKVSTNEKEEACLNIISGASYGSSFVGMIHLLNVATDQLGDLDKLKNALQDKLRIGGWLNNSVGNFGVDDDALNAVKSFLSTQEISAHISIVSIGALPSLASNQLKRSLSTLDGHKIIAIPAQESLQTAYSESQTARQLAQTLNIQNAKIKNMLHTLGKLDIEANKTLDLNSLMSAFENYLTLIKTKTEGNIVGVPIHFYLKRLTKANIIQLWMKQYFPDKKPDTA